MSNFKNFLKSEHIIKSGVSFIIAMATQDFFTSIVDIFIPEEKLKKYGSVVKSLLTLIFVLIFSYLLLKFAPTSSNTLI